MSATQALDSIQALIRSNRLGAARTAIRRLCCRKPSSRSEVVRLAHLARLVLLPEKSLELLHRRVRAGRAPGKATDDEIAEYGMALAHVNASAESIELLSRLDLKKFPFIFAPLCLAYFRQARWEITLPMIKRYLSLKSLSSGDRLNGRRLLGTALLHGKRDFGAAQQLLETVLVEAERDGYPLILREVRLMLIQCYFNQRIWRKARAQLAELKRALPEDEGAIFSLNRLQWQALVDYYAGNDPDRALADLQDVRRRFAEIGRSWNVRSCFYYEAILTQRKELLVEYYFGTPYPKWRARILASARCTVDSLPEFLDWQISSSGAPGKYFVNLLTGQTSQTTVRLKPGQIPWRVLQALASDFFAPPSIAQLFESLYPGEHFHPTAAPARVHQSLLQTREWLDEHRLPLQIVEENGCYRLRSQHSFVLRLPRDKPAEADKSSAAYVVWAQTHFGDREFSSQELADKLGVSERSVRRSLKLAVAQGQLAGGSRRSRYRVRS